jgi:hypothetical protein
MASAIQLKDAVIHGTASEIEFTTLEALKLLVLESLGAEQVLDRRLMSLQGHVLCAVAMAFA